MPYVGELSRRFDGLHFQGASIVDLLAIVSTLENEGHSAFEPSGQFTHALDSSSRRSLHTHLLNPVLIFFYK